ncbi:MAG: DUF3617 domain-containing protein [Proteobacteria bacterium]|nr:DUF3617 domain-containing protein [Pseudomonadota bacterium]
MRKLAFAVIAAVALAATAATPTHRVPGQWEITTSMHFTKGGIQIPPEVRQQMAARGMKMPDFTAPRTFKQCLTAEQIARDEQMQFSQDESCKTSSSKWSGETFHAEFACSNRGKPTQGSVDGTIAAGGKAYTGTFRMQGSDPGLGGQYAMEGHTSGKWLGPTCSQ